MIHIEDIDEKEVKALANLYFKGQIDAQPKEVLVNEILKLKNQAIALRSQANQAEDIATGIYFYCVNKFSKKEEPKDLEEKLEF